MDTRDIHAILDELHSYIRCEIAAGFESPEAIIERRSSI